MLKEEMVHQESSSIMLGELKCCRNSGSREKALEERETRDMGKR